MQPEQAEPHKTKQRLWCLRSDSRFSYHAALVAAWITYFGIGSSIAAEKTAAMADLGIGTVQPPTPQQQQEASALAHYATALSLQAETHIREALPHYQATLEVDPHNTKLSFYVAELALDYADKATALHILQRNIQLQPDSPGPRLNLARFYTVYHQLEDNAAATAREILQQTLLRFPRDSSVYHAAVMHELEQQQRSQAIKLIEQARAQPVTDPHYWLDIGRLAQIIWPLAHPELRDTHRSKVNPFFTKALALSEAPLQPSLLHDVAQYYIVSNQMPSAASVAEKLVHAQPTSTHLKLLARIYEVTKNFATASVPLLEQALKLEPTDVETHRLLADHYSERQATYLQAIPHMEALIQLAGERAEDYLSLGLLHLECDQPEEAILLSQRAIHLFPNNPRFYLLSADCNRTLQRRNSALANYEKAETLAKVSQPNLLTASFYTQWADLLHSDKRYDEAAQKYQRAITLVPEDEPQRAANILNNLGYMWLQQGSRLDQAGDFIQRAVKLEPDSPVYLDSLGWYHFLKQDYPQALKILLQVEKLIIKPEQQDAEILDHIGQTYEKLNDTSKAEDYYRRAVQQDPKNSIAAKHLKQLQEKKGL
jgi:tetratricopeptide (TPR) repeat protein